MENLDLDEDVKEFDENSGEPEKVDFDKFKDFNDFEKINNSDPELDHETEYPDTENESETEYPDTENESESENDQQESDFEIRERLKREAAVKKRMAKNTAKMAVNFVDIPIRKLAETFFKFEPNSLKLEAEEKELLIDLAIPVIEDLMEAAQYSPLMALIGAIIGIYGSKVAVQIIDKKRISAQQNDTLPGSNTNIEKETVYSDAYKSQEPEKRRPGRPRKQVIEDAVLVP